MGVISLLEAAVRMGEAAVDVEAATAAVIEGACVILKNRAQSAIGTYEFGWPSLGPEAVARHGDTPLLETGALKASIQWTAGPTEGWVGTNDPKAAFQEFGTRRGIPPRPFLGGAIEHSIGEIEAMAASMVMAAIGGGDVVGDLFHAAHVAAHVARETKAFVSEMVEEDKQ
jgi:phage gpG-like protein